MKKHKHRGDRWDSYYEHCRCGASAGDKKNKNGKRCITFEEWEKNK